MRPYYFDFDAERTRHAVAILTFERTARRRPPWPARKRRRAAALLGAMLRLIRLWHRRAREREQLAYLDLRMLRDIGISPSDAARESDKPFWRA